MPPDRRPLEVTLTRASGPALPTSDSPAREVEFPAVEEERALAIRRLLWPVEVHELAAVYDTACGRPRTRTETAILAVLHDACRRGGRVSMREVARRADPSAPPSPSKVHHVVNVLRGAGVLASSGGEYDPRRRRRTCQRHQLVPCSAVLAVMSPFRCLQARAYAWAVGGGGMAPDDVGARIHDAQGVAWLRAQHAAQERRARERAERREHHQAHQTDPAAISAEPVPAAAVEGQRTLTRDTAPGKGIALPSVTVSHPDVEDSVIRTKGCEVTITASPATAEVRSLTPPPPLSRPRRDGSARGGWVDPAVLLGVIADDVRRVRAATPLAVAAALYGDALEACAQGRCADPLRAMGDAYGRWVSTALCDADERSRPGCTPIRDPGAWAFAAARRQLRGEDPPPWPERRSRGMRPASPPARAVAISGGREEPSPRPPLVDPAEVDPSWIPYPEPNWEAIARWEQARGRVTAALDEGTRRRQLQEMARTLLAEHERERSAGDDPL